MAKKEEDTGAMEQDGPMKDFVCPVDGCGYATNNQKALSGHMKKHTGWSMQLGEGAQTSHNENYEPANRMSLLKDMLKKVRVRDTVAASIIDRFGYYREDDLSMLKTVLKDAGVPVPTMRSIVDQWEHVIGMADEDGPFRNRRVGSAMEGPMVPDDPLSADPSMLMKMTPAQQLNWAMSMKQYAQKMKWMQTIMDQSLNNTMNDNGGNGNGHPTGTLPPEIQAQLTELRELKEKDRLRDAIRPFMEEVRESRKMIAELDQKLNTKQKDSGTDFNQYLMQLATIKTLGGDKEIQEERLRWEQKNEEARRNHEAEMHRWDQQKEVMRNDNSRIQIEALKTALGSKIERLQEEVSEKKTAKTEILKTLEEAKIIQAHLKELGVAGEESATDRKMEMYGSIIEQVTQTLQPVMMAFVQGNTKPPGAPGAAPPPFRGQGAPSVKQFKCQGPNCGTVFPVAGEPEAVICPSCGTVHQKAPGAAQPPIDVTPTPVPQSFAQQQFPSPQFPPPTQFGGGMGQLDLNRELRGMPGMGGPPSGPVMMDPAEKKKRLDALSDDDLRQAAVFAGFDPGNYQDRHQLIEDLANFDNNDEE